MHIQTETKPLTTPKRLNTDAVLPLSDAPHEEAGKRSAVDGGRARRGHRAASARQPSPTRGPTKTPVPWQPGVPEAETHQGGPWGRRRWPENLRNLYQGEQRAV